MRIDSRSKLRVALVVAALSALTLSGIAQERDRAKIPDKYKWNLSDLYPDDAAWRAAKDKVAAEIPQLGAFKGKLASSPATLADALTKMSALSKELSRLVRLCAHAGGPGHARLASRRHETGDDPAVCDLQCGRVVHRARDPAFPEGNDREIPGRRARG